MCTVVVPIDPFFIELVSDYVVFDDDLGFVYCFIMVCVYVFVFVLS